MTAIVQLDDYLRRVESRLRFLAASRGAAVTAASALFLTLAVVWISNQYRFVQDVVWPLRVLLFAALAVAIAFTLAIPLAKLNRRFVTKLAEKREPSFGERLLTVQERRNEDNPFMELIAEDAMGVARKHAPAEFAHSQILFGALAVAVVALAALLWLITAGPGYWGYGASLLWTGSGNASKKPLYSLNVQPGNKTIRRKSDQLITAHLMGFNARQVTLHAKYGDATKWDATLMQPGTDGNAYQFKFVGLSDQVEYFVQADNSESKHFKIAVRDLPGVKRVKVALHFPAELHLKDAVQDPGGDIRAVEGTDADISVLTDRPLDHGVLMFEDGSKLALTRGEGNWLSAKMSIHKDGSYHVAALDSNEDIRISDDYFIESGKDEPPSVRITNPGKDPKVSPIEEVPVTISATDDFGLEGMDLHYSVNGAPEQVVPLLKTKGVKEADGTKLLSLEDFKLAPGDLIALYATAKDATHTTKSEIIFAQAEPFDFKFSQSQQMGGGGGGGMDGGQQSDISERQKQIIAATWNQDREPGKNKNALQENAKFLSDTEGKLAEQAQTLAERMASREMGDAGSSFANFSKLMTQASGQMNEAVNQLKPGKWRDALPTEQKALQSLLRAEALFRDIQVAFGQRGGGGGGGGAQRDLARMFDLELDTSKNQYETGQQTPQEKQNDQQKSVDEALEKLKELAKRQQELAAQRPQQQAFEQRWQEEQLRREAEELRRQMQEMAQNQQSQSQSGQQSGQQQQSSGSSSGQSSSGKQQQQQASQSGGQQQQQQQRQMNEALRKSMEALRRSEDEMRKAVSEQDPSAQKRAADNLAQAEDLLNKALQKQADSSIAGLSQRAQEMADQQRNIADSLKRAYGEQSGDSVSRRLRMGQPEPGPNELPEMRDPASPRYYGYDRRGWDRDLPSAHTPSQQERAMADEKARLSKEIQDLQHDMQQQERSLASTDPASSSKMRKALSEAEQNELAMREQKTAEWMKQGYGDRNLSVETKMAEGLEKLSKDLQEVQKSVEASQGDGKPGQGNKGEQTLAEVRSLRRMLEQAQQDRAQQQGQGQRQGYQQQTLSRDGQQGQQQGGQQQGGQQQGGQQQGGQQQGGQQQGGQQQSGQQGGLNAGSQYGPTGGRDYGMNQESLQGAINDLNSWRGKIDPHDRQLRVAVDDTLGYLRLLHADPNRLQSTIGQDAVSRLERLEVELARRAGELQQLEGARLRAPEDSPEKYRDAVAEYFRKLSQAKK